MAIYRWNVKVSWIWKSFNPENSWTVGQFLKKTSTWYAFDNIPEVDVDSELSPTSENPVQNKVITNALQNAWWSSDHLEVKAPVWELYQLTDTMFLQNTPTLEDSTVEQKVWDTANNTQIHIQRIASWTGSNELKLKVKKVWTPWDLSVQVMKWIQVTVTANVEAYWYWDSNNVLASWTVSASNITTSRQEITVTLDDEVWWTEWELLDIVLSIPTVNASNYVVIACDSTQWSEWFSLVAVNGSTRTRSKLMPYCISDWFAQSLLVKVSDEKITGRYPVLKSISCTGTTPPQYTGGNKMTPNPINVNETVVKCRIRVDETFSGGGLEIGLRITDKWYPKYWDAEFNLWQNSLSTPWIEINKELSQTLYLRISNWGQQYNRTLTWIFEYYEMDIGEISKNASIKWKPRELKAISQKASTTIFWVHIDNSRVTQDVE